jgi:hypothetical protein
MLLLTLILFTTINPRTTPQPVELRGTVLAYSPFARLVLFVGSPPPPNIKPFHEDFVIRLDRDAPPLNKGQLIRLRYSDDAGTKPEAPSDLFTIKRRWEFFATRDDSCTITLERLFHYTVNGQTYDNMRFTPWTKSLKPVDYALPCYVVADGGFVKQ